MLKFTEWKRELLMSKATSQVEQEKYEFQWRLKNVHELFKIQKRIESPIFVGGPKSLHQWRLALAKTTREDGKDLFLSLNLVKFGVGRKNGGWGTGFSSPPKFASDSGANSSAPLVVKIGFKVISVGGLFETTMIEAKGPNEFQEETTLGAAFSSATLLSYDKLEKGKHLRLRCEILFEGQVKHEQNQGSGKIGNSKLKSGSVAIENGDFFMSLLVQTAKNWKVVLNSGLHSDVSIVTKTRTVPAHKVVLSAHSPVFAAMFLSEMAESVQHTVEIPDFEENIVNLMLEFIYCGSVDPQKLQENAMDLFRIADKYEISHLKGFCELTVLENLSVLNAVDILTLAHFHSPTSLKPKMDPFLKAHGREIQQTDSFKKACKTHPAVIADFNLLFLN